jgi:dihydropteroate synthase
MICFVLRLTFRNFVGEMDYTINVRGRLLDLSEPRVMGILNVTPDSFYADSRQQTKAEIARRAAQIVAEGADIIDIGACSTRPGSQPATEAEETERLRLALDIVRREQPDAVVSVDTFRPDVAAMAVKDFGVDIINDVYPSTEMFRMVSRLRVPYIVMSSKPTLREMLLEFAEWVQLLRDFGQKDIILDPGFGFGKTLEENYAVLQDMERLQVMELPVLVGVSRKSMIWRLLGTSPEEALNGTTVLNTVALQKGANILRVHDVHEAVECVKIVQQINWTRASCLASDQRSSGSLV